jgi:hypothetical protein
LEIGALPGGALELQLSFAVSSEPAELVGVSNGLLLFEARSLLETMAPWVTRASSLWRAQRAARWQAPGRSDGVDKNR